TTSCYLLSGISLSSTLLPYTTLFRSVPNDSLHEDLVFVYRDERTQRAGRQLPEQNAVGGPVAFEGPVGCEKADYLGIHPRLFEFKFDFICGLAFHEGLRLCEEVGEQFCVMIPHGVMADGGGNEVARDQPGSLVYELIEGVLTVGARLAPDYWAGLVIDGLPGAVNRLTVALHIALLKICRKPVKVLVVGEDGLRRRAEEIVVPDADHGEHHGDILFKGCRPEMLVHSMRTFKQGYKVFEAQGTSDGQAHGGPERVASADPVPKLKHVIRSDAELLYRLGVCGDGD